MRRTAVLLAAAVLLSYDSWVLLALSPQPYPLAGYVSELAAADQPYSWVFRTGDAIAGALMVLIAGLGVRGWRTRFGRLSVWVAVAVAITGLGTIGDAIAALPCAQSFDDACYAEYTANPLRPDFLLHAIASSLVALGALASMLLAFLALRRQGRVRTAYARGVVIMLAALLVTNVSSVVIEMLWRTGQGYVQAVAVLIIAAWAAHLGWAAVIDRGTGTRNPAEAVDSEDSRVS
ncbi:DUF998 domain-containing protein [Brevibacterium sp. XM4083]|uniref:DUF998 domain-containing protein n=1 Tax=Brevibacterium sp. XM4083 TaxID=2583238 RepID=UPI00112ACFA6|nr:DUF998 domain-containing protein [Brevibacterium sp. XM4083]MCM1013629.1 DUF998 domain-containing protein [Brevibacterium sp. XM4083]